MYNESLLELIDQFVSYKRANGYQYQTGAYYLKRYPRFVMETVPGTAALNKESVEGFFEQLQDSRNSVLTGDFVPIKIKRERRGG